MSALRKILVVENGPVVGKSVGRVLSNKGYAVITAANAREAEPKVAAAPQPAVVKEEGGVKKFALLLAAPFIGLVYIVLLPFVGLGYLAVAAIKGLARLPIVKTPFTFLKDIGLFIAAPFVGLLYVIMFPFVGATMLVWVGAKALMEKAPAE